MKSVKKLLATLLALAMVLTSLTVTALGVTWTSISGQDKITGLQSGKTYYFKLTGNVYTGSGKGAITIPANAEVHIDIAGQRFYTNASGRVHINNSGTLIITNSEGVDAGEIIGNSNATYPVIDNKGTLSITDCLIAQGSGGKGPHNSTAASTTGIGAIRNSGELTLDNCIVCSKIVNTGTINPLTNGYYYDNMSSYVDDGYACASDTSKYTCRYNVYKAAAQDYTLTYKNGDVVVATESVTEETKFALPGEGSMTQPAGKYLYGWNDGSTTYAVGAQYTMPSNDTTLTAVWEDAPVSLNVNENTTNYGTLNEALLAANALTGNVTATVKLNMDVNHAVRTAMASRANGNVLDLTIDFNGKTLNYVNPVSSGGSGFVSLGNNINLTLDGNGKFDPTQAATTYKRIVYIDGTNATVSIMSGDFSKATGDNGYESNVTVYGGIFGGYEPNKANGLKVAEGPYEINPLGTTPETWEVKKSEKQTYALTFIAEGQQVGEIDVLDGQKAVLPVDPIISSNDKILAKWVDESGNEYGIGEDYIVTAPVKFTAVYADTITTNKQMLAVFADGHTAGTHSIKLGADLIFNMSSATTNAGDTLDVVNGDNITLDLCGNKIDERATRVGFDIAKGGKLTINDSVGGGAIIGYSNPNTTSRNVAIVNAGEFVLNKGSITGWKNQPTTSTAANTRGAGIYNNAGTVIINGGAITGNTAAGIYTSTSANDYAAGSGAGIYNYKGSVIINAGTFSGNIACSNDTNGKGGTTYPGATSAGQGGFYYGRGDSSNKATVVINGGTFTDDNKSEAGYGNIIRNAAGGTGAMTTINGGIFLLDNSVSFATSFSAYSQTSGYALQGGWFSKVASGYAAQFPEGYVMTGACDNAPNPDAPYSVDSKSTYEITFKGPNGENIGVSSISGDHGTKIELPIYYPADPDFACIGWSLSSNPESEDFKVGDLVEMSTDITLYAFTSDDVAHLHYYSDDVEVATHAVVYDTYDVPPTITKDDYVLMGWKVDGKTYAVGEKIKATGDLRVDAIWQEICIAVTVNGVTTRFATLEEAAAFAAPNESATIKLLDNVVSGRIRLSNIITKKVTTLATTTKSGSNTFNLQVPDMSEKNFILDLNGFTWECTSDLYALRINTNTTLTITGNGNVISQNSDGDAMPIFYISDGSKLNVTNGSFNGSTFILGRGDVDVNDGAFVLESLKEYENCTMNIKGGSWNIDPSICVDRTVFDVSEDGGIYTVEAKAYTPVATYDGVAYETVYDAVQAVLNTESKTGTIKLTGEDIDTIGFNDPDARITFDLDGKTVKANGNFAEIEGGSVAFNNGKIAVSEESKIYVSLAQAEFNSITFDISGGVTPIESAGVVYINGAVTTDGNVNQYATGAIIDSAKMSLSESIAFTYIATVAYKEGETYEDLAMLASVGEDASAEYSVSSEDGNIVEFTINGLNPAQSGEKITANVICGGEVCSPAISSSIVDYCVAVNSFFKSNIPVNNLLSDVLKLGIEAYNYAPEFGEEFELPECFEIYGNSATPKAEDNVKATVVGPTDPDNYKIKSASINVHDKTMMYFAVYSTSDDATIEVSTNGKVISTYKFSDLLLPEGSQDATVRELNLNRITPLEYGDAYTVSLKNASGNIVHQIKYSVNSYSYSKASDNAAGDIALAVFRYGRSAEEYVKPSNHAVVGFETNIEEDGVVYIPTVSIYNLVKYRLVYANGEKSDWKTFDRKDYEETSYTAGKKIVHHASMFVENQQVEGDFELDYCDLTNMAGAKALNVGDKTVMKAVLAQWHTDGMRTDLIFYDANSGEEFTVIVFNTSYKFDSYVGYNISLPIEIKEAKGVKYGVYCEDVQSSTWNHFMGGTGSTAGYVQKTSFASLSSATLSKTPNQTSYGMRPIASGINTFGGEVTLTYSDGTISVIPLTNDMLSLYQTKLDSVEFKVTVSGVTAANRLKVTFDAVEIADILNKSVGETFEIHGIVVAPATDTIGSDVNELLVKDVDSNDTIAVKSLGQTAANPLVGLNIGDEILVGVRLATAGSGNDSQAGAKIVNKASDAQIRVLSQKGVAGAKYDLNADMISISNQDEFASALANSSTRQKNIYQLFKFAPGLNFGKYNEEGGAYLTYAGSKSAGNIEGYKIPYLYANNQKLINGKTDAYRDIVFGGKAAKTLPGLNTLTDTDGSKELYMLYIGGTGDYYHQFVLLGEDYVVDYADKGNATSIEVVRQPNTTKIQIGTTISKVSLTGGMLKVTYASGANDLVPMTASMIQQTGKIVEGANALTLSYKGQTAGLTLTGVEISSTPSGNETDYSNVPEAKAPTQSGKERADKAPAKHLLLDENGNYGGTLNLNKYGEGTPLNGALDVYNDDYYSVNDWYNAPCANTAGSNRVILPHFETYQQTMKDSDGIASVLMALNYYGSRYDEEELVKEYEQLNGTKVYGNGTTADGLANLIRSKGFEATANSYDSSVTLSTWAANELKKGNMVMVLYHGTEKARWKLIIGSDGMANSTSADNVFVLADSFDASDHYQDGYSVLCYNILNKWWREIDEDGNATRSRECLLIKKPEGFNVDWIGTVTKEEDDPICTMYNTPERHLLLNTDGSFDGWMGKSTKNTDRDFTEYGDIGDCNGYTLVNGEYQSKEHFEYNYFATPDYYNMTSEGSRLILPNWNQFEQSMASSCGISSTLVTLDYKDFDYEGLSITNLRGTEVGPIELGAYERFQEYIVSVYMLNDKNFSVTNSSQSKFNDYGNVGANNLSYVSELLGYKTRSLESAAQKQGTYYEYWGAASSEKATGASEYGKCRYNFPTYEIFLDYAKRMIASGRPITISWAPGSGHWETIVGIDDMGTPEIYDDVVVLGDSHDGRDHYFDGFNTYPAEMFYFQWYNGTNSLGQAHICIENTYDNMK